MCGIFGYIGKKNGMPIVLGGLKKLEYRGYDSAGIVGLKDGKFLYCKTVGKLDVLVREVENKLWDIDMALGHTRWATHGVPTTANAHPQFDADHTFAIVHNGIIENYEELRRELIAGGSKFESDTDTEVVAHLLASNYSGNLLEAVRDTMDLLEGTYAFAVMHKDYPLHIVTFTNRSPMVIGIGSNESFIASDSLAFADYTRKAIFLNDGEIAMVTPGKAAIYDSSLERVDKQIVHLETSRQNHTKGDYEHYTLKEICQQPESIRNALTSRFLENQGSVVFQEANLDPSLLLETERVLILACGTSYHAGMIASYMLEDLARIPAQVEIASEFRTRNAVILPNTLVIAISQSGETADTLSAVREVQAKGAFTLAICNVEESTLVREADASIFLRAGPEIGVCSTKAYTSQVVILTMLTLLLGRIRHITHEQGIEILNELWKLPDVVRQVLNVSEEISALAKKYAHYKDMFFIGRGYMYPTSLEGALKLKEISYINANGYAAGEMKHGPIALLNPEVPVVALCANKASYAKTLSNMMECKARGSPIIAIAEYGSEMLEGIPDDIIWIPRTMDALATIPASIAAQLLAYYVAKERGTDIDQPKNLAKSVTVE